MNETLDRPKTRRQGGNKGVKPLARIAALEAQTGLTWRESIKAVLREHDGNYGAAAKALGVTTTTLRDWMLILGIRVRTVIHFE